MPKGQTAATSSVEQSTSRAYYLLKAEPDSRIEKGKDVKFSVDDFEQVGTSPWEGVRNYEARNIMKEMKVGDQALFYHSNCKEPGVAAFAEVAKLAYPDYTAWDTTHPYYDPKSDPAKPKWYMVDLTFKFRAKHFVPLALLKYIASISLPASSDGEEDAVPDLVEELSYLNRKAVAAIKGMGLVSRGRLSVQRVSQAEWDAINLLAERGGWEGLDLKKLGSSSSKAASSSKTKSTEKEGKAATKNTKGDAKSAAKGKKRQLDDDLEEDTPEGELQESGVGASASSEAATRSPVAKRYRRGKEQGDSKGNASTGPVRRSSRRAASKALATSGQL